MNRLLQPRAAATAIAVGIAFACGDLLVAWRHAPYDRGGALACVCWLAGGVGIWIRGGRRLAVEVGPVLTALVLALAGFAAQLNVAKHVALALVLTAFLPTGRRRWFWLATAACWMPGLGWLLAPVVNPPAMIAVRLTLAAGGLAAGLGKGRP